MSVSNITKRMMASFSEALYIIRLVEDSELSIRRTLAEINVSRSSFYRWYWAYNLVTSPQFMVMSAADAFQHPTRRVHELWQTDFTYFRVVGWGWYFLSTVLDDYSRYIISWRLTTTMAASDVTDTLDDTLKATGLTEARGHHKPRLMCMKAEEMTFWIDDP